MIDSVLPFLLSKVIFCLSLAYTNPSSYLRPFSSLVIAVCCIVSAQSTLVGLVPGYIGGEYIIGFVLQANNLLCLTRLAPAANLEPFARLRWAFYETFNHRGGVPDQQIPPFNKKRPQEVPSRRSFLLHQFTKILLSAAAMHLLNTVSPSLGLEIDDFLDVPSGFLRQIPSVTSREMLIRVYMTFLTYAIPYASLQAAHALSACVAVACGDSPAHWRPIFGDVWDAWSMRNYYRSFWHSLVRKGFTLHAMLFNNMLGLPRKSQASRFSIIIVTFGLSALMHLVAVPLESLRCSLPTVTYYLSIAGAIILEHIVILLHKSLVAGMRGRRSQKTQAKNPPAASSSQVLAKAGDGTMRRRKQGSSEEASESPKKEAVETQEEDSPSMQWRLLGYCWVIFFSVWNASKMIYTTEQCTFDGLVEKQMVSNETLAFL